MLSESTIRQNKGKILILLVRFGERVSMCQLFTSPVLDWSPYGLRFRVQKLVVRKLWTQNTDHYSTEY